MDIRSFFQRNWIHFAAVAFFLIVGMVYFSQQMQGYSLKQHDIEQFTGAARETSVYREHHDGEEPLWTNSMFGGMPTLQISTIYPGNWFAEITSVFMKTFPSPMGIVLLYMICFYIALCMMQVNRYVAVIGALAFAFLSYDIIILQAGHNTKGVAIAYMAPVVGAMYMAYRRNWFWGAALSGVFMAFEMAANHLQVTYYMGFLLLGLGLVELYRMFRNKTYAHFLKTSAAIGTAYLLAILVNFGNIKLTADYAEYSIRGANDITINSDGSSNTSNSTEGLNRDYVVEYSYGLGESFNLLSPYVKGAGTMAFADSPFAESIGENEDLTQEEIDAVLGSSAYWGEQPATSGPAYIGVILVFLALLGMVYIKDPLKYALLGVTILTLMLSWGKNYMGLTNWFLDHVPGYDKFRAVTIILVIVELCVPLLAILFLDKLVKEREQIRENIKPFYITAGGFIVFLLVLKMAGIDKSYLSSREYDPQMLEQRAESIRGQIMAADPQQLAANGIDKNNPQQVQQIIDSEMERFDKTLNSLKTVREGIFHSSMNRSIAFAFFAALALLLLFRTSVPTPYVVAGLGLLILIDIISVTRNYLNNDEIPTGSGYKYWEAKLNVMYPITPTEADLQIMESELAANPALKQKVEAGRREGKNKAIEEFGASNAEAKRIGDAYAFSALNENTNYRVFDVTGGFSNSARASYLHKSIGGYHGAKLRSIQNLFEFHIARTNNKVLNMLNIKYIIQQDATGQLIATKDTAAMGNAWFVNEVKVVPDANAEILALGSRFEMQNFGKGKLFVNGQEKPTAVLYGNERLQYVAPGRPDTIDLPLSGAVPLNMEVCIVSDVNGRVTPVPRQTVDMDTANSFTMLTCYKRTEEFDLDHKAVIRKDMSDKLSGKTFRGTGSVKMTSYAPNKLTYSVDASDKSLVVFSEIYYPEGWTASIDGEPADILRLNYLLRGLEIPKGKHKVVFTYDIASFHSFNLISLLASLLILLLAIGGCVYTARNRRKEADASTLDS